MRMYILPVSIGSLGAASATIVEARPVRHFHHSQVVVVKKKIIEPEPVIRAANIHTDVRPALPVRYIRISHRGTTCYYHDGIYYRKMPNSFAVMRPLAGFRVAGLPHG